MESNGARIRQNIRRISVQCTSKNNDNNKNNKNINNSNSNNNNNDNVAIFFGYCLKYHFFCRLGCRISTRAAILKDEPVEDTRSCARSWIGRRPACPTNCRKKRHINTNTHTHNHTHTHTKKGTHWNGLREATVLRLAFLHLPKGFAKKHLFTAAKWIPSQLPVKWKRNRERKNTGQLPGRHVINLRWAQRPNPNWMQSMEKPFVFGGCGPVSSQVQQCWG